MAKRKQYADPYYYENKLSRVMERLGLERDDYNYNFDRRGCWVEFRYKGELYRFDHTVEKAQANGVDLTYGSDAFAQVVLALEDLTRIVERGIYDLSTWVNGMKFLPPPTVIPTCFQVLGYDSMPTSVADVKARYRALSKQYHPDVGGDAQNFETIRLSAEQAIRHFEAVR